MCLNPGSLVQDQCLGGKHETQLGQTDNYTAITDKRSMGSNDENTLKCHCLQILWFHVIGIVHFCLIKFLALVSLGTHIHAYQTQYSDKHPSSQQLLNLTLTQVVHPVIHNCELNN